MWILRPSRHIWLTKTVSSETVFHAFAWVVETRLATAHIFLLEVSILQYCGGENCEFWRQHLPRLALTSDKIIRNRDKCFSCEGRSNSEWQALYANWKRHRCINVHCCNLYSQPLSLKIPCERSMSLNRRKNTEFIFIEYNHKYFEILFFQFPCSMLSNCYVLMGKHKFVYRQLNID